ncbi:MAG: GspH/FimT family pseudopilin [Pseudomonadota bacterium]|nr:GspH/FimT family pseudopilin [Pseudomonadota bacterium]
MNTFAAPLRSRGFTLIEMLVTMAVIAILLTIVTPSLAALVSTSRTRAAQSELIASLSLARSEAAKRGKTVYVSATAPVNGNEFGAGWTVWVDEDDSGAFNAGDTLIRQFPDISAGVVLGTASHATQVSFAPTGFLSSLSSLTFKVCGNNASSNGYTVALQATGMTDLNDQIQCN